jgi:hypothetical protein
MGEPPQIDRALSLVEPPVSEGRADLSSQAEERSG